MSAPHLRVVRGEPSPEELAALTMAVVAVAAGDTAAPPARVRRGAWSDPARQLRKPLSPGPNGWQASAR